MRKGGVLSNPQYKKPNTKTLLINSRIFAGVVGGSDYFCVGGKRKMTRLKFISGLLLTAFIACGQSSNNRTPSTTNNHKNDNSQVKYVLFGVFCGECSGHCATMFRYNMMGNSNTLFIDSTDSYFKNYGKVVCKTQISDINKFQLINKLVRQIPSRLLASKKLEETFGCPDCTDGCGIYFEIGQYKSIKKIYIDYHTSELSNDIKDFGELIKTTLVGLNKK